MKTTAMAAATGELLLEAGDRLIEAIERALSTAARNGTPEDWKTSRNNCMGDDADAYPERAFRDTAITNLRGYRKKVTEALREIGHGHWLPLWQCSMMYAGLSKQMDFDFGWMAAEDRERVEEALSYVVHLASAISDKGHELRSQGRKDACLF